MKHLSLFLLSAGGLLTVPAADLPSWRGDALKAWTSHNHDVRDVRVENGVLKAVVTGRDSQFYARLDAPLKPQPNHIVYVKAKAPSGGRAQLFWIREGDRQASEARQRAFMLQGDGAWHTYRIRPGWGADTAAVRMLRLDFPVECAGETPVEIAEVKVVEEGALVNVDTSGKIGVGFSLQMPSGLHYCTLTWSSTEGPGALGFTTATDGAPHNYWFNLREARIRGWGPDRGRPCWKGRITQFLVEQVRYDRELPVKDLVFLDARPDTPADPVITSARSDQAIPRAGRPFVVEAIVRNFGSRPAKNLRFAFDGLPAGVTVLDAAELTPPDALRGSDGTETIWWDCRPPLAAERIYRIRLSDPGAGHLSFGLTLTADGVPARRTAVEADVLPSLDLAKRDYPAEPVPVGTTPYEIGALLFPGWTNHRWHGVWSHAPERKPVLGWYDEENPETIDWQIKHLVENGVSWVSVDWYWNRGHQHLNHWMKAFGQAKYRKCLKWHLMWANHNGFGSHSVADQEKVTKFWIENFFGDPQYQRVDGMPVVTIWNARGMEADLAGKGGCRGLLEVSQKLARAAGYKGVYFVAMRGPDTEDAGFLKGFAEKGFGRTCVYKYMGGVRGCPSGPAGSRPFKWVADTSLEHWRTLRRNSTVPFWPSLSTAWDDRPWRGESGWAITGVNAADFRRICAAARAYSDESGERMLLMGPLDEWGEGSIGYPNAELGFGMLEAVRDTFGKKPAAGWPINHAPEDVGLVCPQRKVE